MAILSEQILKEIGFKFNGHKYDLSVKTKSFDLSLSAVRGMNRHFVDAVLITGYFHSPRAISQVNIEMLPECESLEQGLAIIAFGLKSARQVLLHENIWWFKRGDDNRNLHPFFQQQEKDRAIREARPHCYVDRDWFRVFRKKITERLDHANAVPAFIDVSFNGEVIRFSGLDFEVGVPATGVPWSIKTRISGSFLSHFPKRFSLPTVAIEIWDGNFVVGNYIFKLLRSLD